MAADQLVTHPYFEGAPAVLAMSHAGVCGPGVANGSLAAYQRAYEQGFRWFQVDVVAAGGGSLASAHAVFGRRRSWENRSIEQISSAAGREIASLNALLSRFPDVRWNIEVKSRRAEPALRSLLSQPGTLARVCVSAPFHRRLAHALRADFGDHICLSAPALDGGLLGLGRWPGPRVRYDAVQIWWPFVRSPRIVAKVVKSGVRFQTWTVNNPQRAHRLIQRGVTGIITDHPTTLPTHLP